MKFQGDDFQSPGSWFVETVLSRQKQFTEDVRETEHSGSLVQITG